MQFWQWNCAGQERFFAFGHTLLFIPNNTTERRPTMQLSFCVFANASNTDCSFFSTVAVLSLHPS
jgi:hypothetical protein